MEALCEEESYEESYKEAFYKAALYEDEEKGRLSSTRPS